MNARPKPKVLLVDDEPRVIESLAQLNFEVSKTLLDRISNVYPGLLTQRVKVSAQQSA